MQKCFNIKLVITGNKACGKTSILARFYRDIPPSAERLVVVNDCKPLTVGERVYNIACWETVSGEEYARLRPHSYYDAFCLLLVVDISDVERGDAKFWADEFWNHCPGVPVILVGSKVDLRDENSVSFEEGRQMAERIGAVCYMECSALTGEGVNEVFVHGVELGSICFKNLKVDKIPKTFYLIFSVYFRVEKYSKTAYSERSPALSPTNYNLHLNLKSAALSHYIIIWASSVCQHLNTHFWHESDRSGVVKRWKSL
eukprot:sb/3468555/